MYRMCKKQGCNCSRTGCRTVENCLDWAPGHKQMVGREKNLEVKSFFSPKLSECECYDREGQEWADTSLPAEVGRLTS